MSLTFGVVDCATGYGLAQSADYTYTAEIAEARDCTGKVNTMKAYSVGREATVEVLVNGTLPSPGATATYGTIAGLVSSVTVSESNTGFQSGRVTVRNADTATLIAYA